MALPQSFNDPFDCKVSILGKLAGPNQKDVFNKLRVSGFLIAIQRAIKKKQPLLGMTRKEMKRILEKARKSKDHNEIFSIMKKKLESLPIKIAPLTSENVINAIDKKLTTIGVFSLTEDPANILMWTHYADNHRGFCLGFERRNDNLLGSQKLCKSVNYVNEFPKLNIDKLSIVAKLYPSETNPKVDVEIKLHEPNLHNAIFTKAKAWSYEKEWRYITDSGGKAVKYPGNLREVIFGLRCHESERNQVIHILKRHSLDNIAFKQIMSVKNSFNLEVRNLKI